MNIGILVAVLIYEVVIILGVGLWLAKREAAHAAEEGDFALAGRHLPLPVVAITLALTVLGTAHILGIFEIAWFLGASAVWFSISHVVLLVLVCLTTGLWVRRLGLTTVPEILKLLYGRTTRLLVSCTMAGVIFGILTMAKNAVANLEHEVVIAFDQQRERTRLLGKDSMDQRCAAIPRVTRTGVR